MGCRTSYSQLLKSEVSPSPFPSRRRLFRSSCREGMSLALLRQVRGRLFLIFCRRLNISWRRGLWRKGRGPWWSLWRRRVNLPGKFIWRPRTLWSRRPFGWFQCMEGSVCRINLLIWRKVQSWSSARRGGCSISWHWIRAECPTWSDSRW